MIIEDDMTIALINAEMEALFGYLKGEIEGLAKWTDFVPNEDLRRMEGYHRLRRSDPEAVPKSYEFQFIHRNGDLRDASLTATLIPETKQSVVSIRDITEKKRLERGTSAIGSSVQNVLRSYQCTYGDSQRGWNIL